ncbi:hypothetical protein L615_007500000170 [Nocardioides sp. J9]|uniref:hypothetical protein n=1 Tax=Nocardioides sp. J9 TaxID=935844 RepID=UPI0011A307C4|nr:hypothetical protein [Nocardioides sp. J9]TWG92007.1 hypothetical protein L615_007500000170 [Nocardioides sp. J9]
MLEVRLPSPVGALRSPWPYAAVLVGTLLVVGPLAALASQGLDSLDRLDALMIVLAGVVMAGWGLRELGRPTSLLRHDSVLRLDESGVAVHTGGARDGGWAHVAWPDLMMVEVAWWEIVPPYVEEPEHLPVLRFVTSFDAVIRAQPTELSQRLGHSFSITPEEASLVAILDGRIGEKPLAQVRQWLAEHQPELPVDVGRRPEL